MRRPGPVSTALVLSLTLLAAQRTRWAAADEDDLDQRLSSVKRELEDPTLDLDRREQTALDMAVRLDQAAQEAQTSVDRRKRWTEAINLLDAFEARNRGHARSDEFRFQSAVYIWARGRLWADQSGQAPDKEEPKQLAIENLDVAISRFRSLNTSIPSTERSLLDNVRFRLAQSLGDRARLDPKDSDLQRERREEALKALETPIEQPQLQHFAILLRAELLGLLNREKQALRILKEAEAAPNQSIPPDSLLETLVGLRVADEQFDQALEDIKNSKADELCRDRMKLRVRVGQRGSMLPGASRSRVEQAMFETATSLRGRPEPEARAALVDLSRSVSEPDATQDPMAWDLLTDIALGQGDLARASALAIQGAARADALRQPKVASALRLKGGAALFRAGQYLEADKVFSQLTEDAQGGESRPKAGLLRIMARARALADGIEGASQTDYRSALEYQIKTFPEDPSSSEARWLLGKVERAARPSKARALWSAIPRSAPQWLDSRLAILQIQQDQLDNQRLVNNRAHVKSLYNEAKSFLNKSYGEAKEDRERAAINLGLIRLELTPEVGEPANAQKLCDVVQRSVALPQQRLRAQQFKVVALCQLARFLEAEKIARAEVETGDPAEQLESLRLLDQTASEFPQETTTRRVGLILRFMLAKLLERPEAFSSQALSELRMRQTRALLFLGDDERARASITAGWGESTSTDDATLRDLADTYLRLGAFKLAAEAQRLRARQASSGSPSWFEARYGLALAEYRAGNPTQAAKLIDGIAILHPEMGGGELKEKFDRLRTRLATGD